LSRPVPVPVPVPVVDGTAGGSDNIRPIAVGAVVEETFDDHNSYNPLPGQEQQKRIPVIGNGNGGVGGGSGSGGGSSLNSLPVNGGGSLTVANFITKPQPRPISEQQYVPAGGSEAGFGSGFGPGKQYQQSDYIMPQTRPALVVAETSSQSQPLRIPPPGLQQSSQQQQQQQQQVRPAVPQPTQPQPDIASNTIQQDGSRPDTVRNDLKFVIDNISRPGSSTSTATTMLRSSSSTLRSSTADSFASTRESQRANQYGGNNDGDNNDGSHNNGERRYLQGRPIDLDDLFKTRRPVPTTAPNPAYSLDIKQRPIDRDYLIEKTPPTMATETSLPDTLTGINFGDGVNYVPIHQVQKQYQQQQQQKQQDGGDNIFGRPIEGQGQEQEHQQLLFPVMPRETPIITKALPGIGENVNVVPITEVTQSVGQQQQQQQQQQHDSNYNFREKMDVESKQKEIIEQQDEKWKQQIPSPPVEFSMNNVGRPGFSSAFTRTGGGKRTTSSDRGRTQQP